MIAYKTFNEDKPKTILFFSGLFFDYKSFRYFIRNNFFKEYRLVFFDYPHFGKSFSNDFSKDSILREISEFINDKVLHVDFTISFSFGCLISYLTNEAHKDAKNININPYFFLDRNFIFNEFNNQKLFFRQFMSFIYSQRYLDSMDFLLDDIIEEAIIYNSQSINLLKVFENYEQNFSIDGLNSFINNGLTIVSQNDKLLNKQLTKGFNIRFIESCHASIIENHKTLIPIITEFIQRNS